MCQNNLVVWENPILILEHKIFKTMYVQRGLGPAADNDSLVCYVAVILIKEGCYASFTVDLRADNI